MIVDQFGRPFESRKAPERRPLAVAPLLDSWRDYVADGLTPERLAAIFKEADGGDVRRQAELFDQMEERDGHLLGERGKRVNVILDAEFTLAPASDDARDARVAEFVQRWLDGLTDWDGVLVGLQDSVGKGFAAMEIHWDVSSGQAVPSGFEFQEQKRFLFTDPKGVLRKYPLLLSDQDTMGAEIPAWKMVLNRYGGKAGNATRSGIYRVCAWMYLFKHYAIKDWVTFAEVCGMPLRLGKYSPGASKDDKDALALAISSLGSDAAGIISKSTEIEFIEAQKDGSINVYESLTGFSNREISKALVGQTLSAEVGDQGSYAAAQTHNEVRLDLIKADARALAATVRAQIIRPLVGFNFGWDTPCPAYDSQWDEAGDFKAKAEWVGGLLDRGVTMPVHWVRSEFRIPEPNKGEEVVGGVAPVAAKRIVAGGVGRTRQDLGVRLAARAGALAVDPVGGMVDQVRDLVDSAASLEEIRDKLIGLYPDMDPGDLGDLMQQVLTMADQGGRWEVLGNA